MTGKLAASWRTYRFRRFGHFLYRLNLKFNVPNEIKGQRAFGQFRRNELVQLCGLGFQDRRKIETFHRFLNENCSTMRRWTLLIELDGRMATTTTTTKIMTTTMTTTNMTTKMTTKMNCLAPMSIFGCRLRISPGPTRDQRWDTFWSRHMSLLDRGRNRNGFLYK